MGALSGSVTFTTYYVRGELPEDFRDRYLASMPQKAFREIDVHADREESFGWVSIEDPFDTEFNLNKVLWGDYLMLSMRQDTIRVPPTAFKLYFKKEMAEYLEKTGKQKVTKAEQEEVRDFLEKKLRKRQLPNIRTFDMVWNIDRKVLWFFTTNNRVNEVFQELFTDTFELPIAQRNPYSHLEEIGLDGESLEHAVSLEPVSLAVPPERR